MLNLFKLTIENSLKKTTNDRTKSNPNTSLFRREHSAKNNTKQHFTSTQTWKVLRSATHKIRTDVQHCNLRSRLLASFEHKFIVRSPRAGALPPGSQLHQLWC